MPLYRSIKQLFLHLFTPQESNNYKAKTLHVDYLYLYLIGALLLTFTIKNIGPYFNNVLGFATDITIPKLLELTNQMRTQQSLPQLTYNQTLAEAAQKKAADMFAKNYWAHFAPDGTSPWNFILNSGYQYEYAGENLAKNFLFSQGVVDDWMNSPTHRQNLLKREYAEVGFAIVNGVLNGEETTMVVQMFATPLTGTVNTAQQPIEQTHPQKVQEIPIQTVEKKAIVLGKENKKPQVNLLPFSINATYVFILFFTFVLLADFYISSKMQIIKIGGKHMAHLMFIGFILLSIVFILKNGAII